MAEPALLPFATDKHGSRAAMWGEQGSADQIVEPMTYAPHVIEGGRALREEGAPVEPGGLPRIRVATPARRCARLLGRSAELQALLRLFERARAGAHGGLVLLSGEAGIGKTRLVCEAATRFNGALRFLWGAAEPLEQERFLGAFSDALASGRPDPSSGCGSPSKFWSGSATTAEELSAEGARSLRFQVLEEMVESVNKMCRSQPLALVLENVHWADASTLLAITRLARDLGTRPLAIIATHRPASGTSYFERWLDVVVDMGGRQVALGPLSDVDALALTSELLGAQPGPRLTAKIRGAGGNPLFVSELVAALDEDGSITRSEGRAEVPDGSLPPSLRLAILRRLAFLPQETLAMLRIATILGATFSLEDLAAVSNRHAMELLASLDPAFRAEVLVGAADRLKFRHELVAEALYHDLPLAVRKALHREVGETLAAAARPALEVATQLSLGAFRGDGRAVEWLRRAATAATTSAAARPALLQRALDIAPDDHPERDGIQAELLEALVDAGRFSEAEDAAAAVLDGRGSFDQKAEARVSLIRALVINWRVSDAVIHAEAVEDGGSYPEAARAWMLAFSAAAWVWNGDLPHAREAARRVASSGLDGLYPGAGLCARAALVLADALEGAVTRSARAMLDVLQPADDRGRHEHKVYVTWAALLLHLAGCPDAALELLDAPSDDPEVIEGSPPQPEMLAVRAALRAGKGDWNGLLLDHHRALELAGQAGRGLGVFVSFAEMVRMQVLRADLRGARATLEEAERHVAKDNVDFPLPLLARSRALLLEAEGEPHDAFLTLDSALRTAEAANLFVAYWLLGPDLVRLGLATGNESCAHSVVSRVGEKSSQDDPPVAAALRCLGLYQDDSSTLLQAADAYGDSGATVDMLLCREEAGLALAKEGKTDAAVSLLDETIGEWERLGAALCVSRARRRLREIGVRRGQRGGRCRAKVGWESLTEAERRVLQLVGEGLCNGEIAARLFLSKRTVETHVSHVLRKLEITTRSELVARVATEMRGGNGVHGALIDLRLRR